MSGGMMIVKAILILNFIVVMWVWFQNKNKNK
jgi:hypothetical protein